MTSDIDYQRHIIDRYFDIVKLRSAQILAFFLAYGFSIRASANFLDNASVSAMSLPIFAWLLDVVARRHYATPLAYAAISARLREGTFDDIVDGDLACIILDFDGRSKERLEQIFNTEKEENLRRKEFKKWFTFRKQLGPFLALNSFSVFAFFATGGSLCLNP